MAAVRSRLARLLTTADSRYINVARTAGAGFASKIVTAVAGLVMVPMLLKAVGPELFGVWATFQSLLAFSSFADFGIGNGMINAIAAANATSDKHKMTAIVSSGVYMLTAIAALLAAAAAAAWPVVDWPALLVRAPQADSHQLSGGLAVFVAYALLSMPLASGDRVATALQEGFVLHVSRALAAALAVGLVWWTTSQNMSFVAICAATLLPNLALTVVTWLWVTVKRPWLVPRLRNVEPTISKRLLWSGSAFLLVQITALLGFNLDTLIVSRYMGATEAATLAVPTRLFSLATVIGNLLLTPLWPAYADASASKQYAWARNAFCYSLLLAFCIGATTTSAIALFGPSIIRLWVGDALPVPQNLLVATGIWATMLLIGSAVAMLWNGLHWMRLQIAFGLIFLLSSVPLKLYSCQTGSLFSFTLVNIACYGLLVLAPAIPLTIALLRRSATAP